MAFYGNVDAGRSGRNDRHERFAALPSRMVVSLCSRMMIALIMVFGLLSGGIVVQASADHQPGSSFTRTYQH